MALPPSPPPPDPTEPPPPEEPPPRPRPIAHVNELAGISFTYYSFLPLETHDGWSALQAIEAWSSSSTETTWNVCGYSGCYCRRRGGTDLVATICPDVSLCQGCTEIGASGYMISTPTVSTRDGLPRCAQADENCPTPANPARAPWY